MTGATERPFGQRSEDELADIVALDGAPVDAWIAWAQAALARSEPLVALHRLEALEQAHPGGARVVVRHVVRARALGALGRNDEADALLDELVERGNNAVFVWTDWARSALRSGRPAVAAERFRRCVDRFGADSPTDWYVDGYRLLLEAGEHDRASSTLALLLQRDPSLLRVEVDHPDPRVSDALTFVGARVGPALAELLARDYDRTAAEHGTSSAVQHVRNVLNMCAQGKMPACVADLVPANTPANRLSALRIGTSLLGNVLAGSATAPPLVGAGGGKGRRVLVVASYLPASAPGPHMRFVNSYAAAFAMLPEVAAVAVLITEELGPEGPNFSDGPVDDNRRQDWERDLTTVTGAPPANVTLLTVEREGPVHPQSAALEVAAGFQPDLLVTVEGIYSSPVVAPVLARLLPTIAAQTSGRLPEPAHADLVLAHGNAVDFSDRPTPAKWRRQPIPVLGLARTSGQPAPVLSGAVEVGVVTALSAGRLEKCLREDGGAFARRIVEALTARPALGWSLFGFTGPDESTLAFERFATAAVGDRLALHGFVDDLRAHLARHHVVFAPEGVSGGAMGIAMAVEEGLAVVAPRNCDAANFLPAEWLYETTEQSLSLLAALVDNARLRAHVASSQLRHLRRHHSIEAVSGSMPAMIEAVDAKFTARP